MLFSRTRGPRSRQQIQLHYLAVCRQVHSCSYLLFIFSKLLAKIPVVLLLHFKAKVLLSQLICLVVSNHGGCRPWYEYGGGPTTTGKFTKELITNVASDSSTVNNGQP
jgi:hypothetical protein